MSELEEKLNQVLSDPTMMQQIMALANSMGAQSNQEPPPPQQQEPSPLSGMDLGMLQQLASGTGVDANQRALLKALSPYISRDRTAKLEKAMRAAKMATLASTLLGRR